MTRLRRSTTKTQSQYSDQASSQQLAQFQSPADLEDSTEQITSQIQHFEELPGISQEESKVVNDEKDTTRETKAAVKINEARKSQSDRLFQQTLSYSSKQATPIVSPHPLLSFCHLQNSLKHKMIQTRSQLQKQSLSNSVTQMLLTKQRIHNDTKFEKQSCQQLKTQTSTANLQKQREHITNHHLTTLKTKQ